VCDKRNIPHYFNPRYSGFHNIFKTPAPGGKNPRGNSPTLCQISVYMHLISLGLLRFVEYMSAVYVDEEFGDLFQPEDTYEYWRRQVSSAATSGANPGAWGQSYKTFFWCNLRIFVIS
jgi:hypothetical protein